MTGTHRLAWQEGPRVRFAEVALACEWTDERGCRLETPPGLSDSWEIGLRFGAEMFDEDALRERGRGLAIRVTSLQGQPVDTSVADVAHAVFQALVAATGLGDRDRFRLDPTTGQFTLGRSGAH